jgi:hypothetical protein
MNSIQLKIAEQSRIAQEAMDQILLLLVTECRKKDLPFHHKIIMERDKVRLVNVKQGLRHLEINELLDE